METSEIGIFESISLLSNLMPYYGSSPEGFLLLSLLSKSVREYFIKHYPQYRRFMLKYAKMIGFMGDEHLEMKLPLDLFKFSILYVYTEKEAEFLVSLIHNLTNKEGLYFGEHYMSDQICFGKIYVDPERIPTLHPHIESLNSIKVFSFEGQDLSPHHSFLDLIVLDGIFDSKNKLKACFFIDSELKEINPIYESFKRIKELYFSNYNGAFARLNLIKQVSIQEIEFIIFDGMNGKEDEQITNQLLNYKIHKLDYSEEESCESMSNLALEDISKINPQKLNLPYLITISGIFRIFLHLQDDINVSFGLNDCLYPITFEKTLALFKTKDDMIKAYCDTIEFLFKNEISEENVLFLENYVCISNIEAIAIKKIKKENLTTENPLEGLSLDNLKNESCILIPNNNLSCIRLNLREISYIFENEINVANFKSLSLKTKIIIELYSMDDLSKLNKLKEYFPEHSELAIDFSHSGINNTNFDEALLLAILSKFELTSLVVRNGNKDEKIFMSLLQMNSIQETLEHFIINFLDIFKCISVVELLVEFNKIKTIKIGCDYDDKLEECKLEIKQFKKKLKKKHSEIEIFIGYQKRDL